MKKRNYSILQDWCEGNSQKGKFISLLFRVASLATAHKAIFIILFPYLIFYKFFVEWLLGIELPYNLMLGSGLKLFHGQALVINSQTVIGKNCTLRHSTTIGNIDGGGGQNACPVIGDNVEIGASVCIIGNITIGSNVKIGAGSIVVKDIPSNCIVVGNPGRVVKIL